MTVASCLNSTTARSSSDGIAATESSSVTAADVGLNAIVVSFKVSGELDGRTIAMRAALYATPTCDIVADASEAVCEKCGTIASERRDAPEGADKSMQPASVVTAAAAAKTRMTDRMKFGRMDRREKAAKLLPLQNLQALTMRPKRAAGQRFGSQPAEQCDRIPVKNMAVLTITLSRPASCRSTRDLLPSAP